MASLMFLSIVFCVCVSRSETVVERMLCNWMSICLYQFLRVTQILSLTLCCFSLSSDLFLLPFLFNLLLLCFFFFSLSSPAPSRIIDSKKLPSVFSLLLFSVPVRLLFLCFRLWNVDSDSSSWHVVPMFCVSII